MLKRTASIIFWLLLLTCAVCFGQSKYNNQLQPGLNTRSDAERVLGRPVRALSGTDAEYAPPDGVATLTVSYRSGSAVIERIELQFSKPISRSAMISSLKLPNQPDATKTWDGKLVEYFREPALVLTYASGEPTSGVKTLGYYSRELLESAAPELRRNRPGVQQGGPHTGLNASGGNGFAPRVDNTTYLGTTIRFFGVKDVVECENACAADAQCRGYALVKRGFYHASDPAVCYLKSELGDRRDNSCCITAVKNR